MLFGWKDQRQLTANSPRLEHSSGSTPVTFSTSVNSSSYWVVFNSSVSTPITSSASVSVSGLFSQKRAFFLSKRGQWKLLFLEALDSSELPFRRIQCASRKGVKAGSQTSIAKCVGFGSCSGKPSLLRLTAGSAGLPYLVGTVPQVFE